MRIQTPSAERRAWGFDLGVRDHRVRVRHPVLPSQWAMTDAPTISWRGIDRSARVGVHDWATTAGWTPRAWVTQNPLIALDSRGDMDGWVGINR